jgi:hypothetical protein
MMTGEGKVLEVIPYKGEGYAPLLFSAGWMVAILNSDPSMDSTNLSEMERHAQTDEVFGLWCGRAALVVKEGAEIQVTELQPGVIYNVRSGGWHTVIASRDASMWIVENRDTHLHDTELRRMTVVELAQARRRLPEWAQVGEAGTK